MNDETAHGDAKSPISDTKSTPLIPISAAVPRQSAGTTTSLAIMQIMRLREQPFMLSNVTDAPSTISASGVATAAISETVLSIVSGRLILNATDKSPSAEPIISGFLAMPFKIFSTFIFC